MYLGSRNPLPQCASGTCFPKVSFYQVNLSIKTTHRSRSALILWFLFPLLPCAPLFGLFSCVRVCMCFSVMRNTDSAGREISGWEPINSADKASSRASPGPSRVGQAVRLGARNRIRHAEDPRCWPSARPGSGQGWGRGRRHRVPSLRHPRAPPPSGRSWRVKMRALIVTKRRRPPARPPSACGGACGPRSCAPAALASPATRPRVWREGGRALGATAPCALTRAGAQLPAPLCAFCSARR